MAANEQDSRLGSKVLIRLTDVKRKTGCCRTTIYAAMQEGRFPRSIRLGLRSVAWLESEIDAWIDDRIKERDKAVSIAL